MATDTRENLAEKFVIDWLLDDLDCLETGRPPQNEEDYRAHKKTAKAIRRVLKYYGCIDAPKPLLDFAPIGPDGNYK